MFSLRLEATDAHGIHNNVKDLLRLHETLTSVRDESARPTYAVSHVGKQIVYQNHLTHTVAFIETAFVGLQPIPDHFLDVCERKKV